jgi:integrase
MKRITMKLTDTFLRKAKPTSGYQDFSDAGFGLIARLRSDGAIIWFWRGKKDGVRSKHQIGSFPAMGVTDARSVAAALRSQSKAFVIKPASRPIVVPRHVTVAAAFKRYAEEHLPDLASGDGITGQMNLRILPVFGDRDIRSLTRTELNDHFTAMRPEYKGTGINRVLAQFKAFLGWAVRENLVDQNPAVGIQMKVKEKARARVMKGAELGYLVRGIDGMGVYRDPLSLLLLGVARLSDIFCLRWCEVVFQNGNPVELHIEKTKSGVSHIIPLSGAAAKLIPSRPATALDKDFVFPNISRARGSSYLTKIRKLTGQAAAASGRNEPIAHFTIHDWRTFATTYFFDQIGREDVRFTESALDMVLAHVPKTITRKYYNQSSHLRERIEMMRIWADYVERCRSESFR